MPDGLMSFSRQRVGRCVRVLLYPEQPFSPENVPNPTNHLLLPQHGPDTALRLGCDGVNALRLRILAQRVRPDSIDHILSFAKSQRTTNCWANQIRPGMLSDDPHPGGGARFSQLYGAIRMVFLFPDLARCPNRGMLLPTEGPGTIHTQMHIEYQPVIEIQKPMLAVGFGGDSAVPVE